MHPTILEKHRRSLYSLSDMLHQEHRSEKVATAIVLEDLYLEYGLD